LPVEAFAREFAFERETDTELELEMPMPVAREPARVGVASATSAVAIRRAFIWAYFL